ncbi:hypothetical protein [Allorhodopirellula heiligendammensis]|uniref:Uncharacterized protein n=1 Tax=Allorhodopirellula heiligendammensis TaxID=2714739 RepID=A0A5C6C5W3_9BACT|nr:hypothetical protein [Allorhodopirellula heiligendammensis]TWU19397.1 hypothetical protein Poly21_15700 [Allorhodopirellula heiligendammensis]|tara:strand:- start:720 stop:917 length:198 start_codon:yes stop_codon:yes gene_type:complete
MLMRNPEYQVKNAVEVDDALGHEQALNTSCEVGDSLAAKPHAEHLIGQITLILLFALAVLLQAIA